MGWGWGRVVEGFGTGKRCLLWGLWDDEMIGMRGVRRLSISCTDTLLLNVLQTNFVVCAAFFPYSGKLRERLIASRKALPQSSY